MQVVINVLNVQLALLDRLSALETAATLQPMASEDLRSKAYWEVFVGPMSEDMGALCAAAAGLAASAATVLQTGKQKLTPELDEQLQEMDRLRYRAPNPCLT